MGKHYIFAACAILLASISALGCAAASPDVKPPAGEESIGLQEIEVTSEELNDGVWDAVITNTANGENRSPELSWTTVPDASEYAVYMIDPDGNGWLHWRAYGITGTHLDAGEQVPGGEYIGPYPPSGTHRYVVTVYALRSPADEYPGNFDAGGNDVDEIEKSLDVAGGKPGNIIRKGSLTGTYTAGD